MCLFGFPPVCLGRCEFLAVVVLVAETFQSKLEFHLEISFNIFIDRGAKYQVQRILQRRPMANPTQRRKRILQFHQNQH